MKYDEEEFRAAGCPQDDPQYCHECQIERGGRLPSHAYPDSFFGICDGCEKETDLIPSEDYKWPREMWSWE